MLLKMSVWNFLCIRFFSIVSCHCTYCCSFSLSTYVIQLPMCVHMNKTDKLRKRNEEERISSPYWQLDNLHVRSSLLVNGWATLMEKCTDSLITWKREKFCIAQINTKVKNYINSENPESYKIKWKITAVKNTSGELQ